MFEKPHFIGHTYIRSISANNYANVILLSQVGDSPRHSQWRRGGIQRWWSERVTSVELGLCTKSQATARSQATVYRRTVETWDQLENVSTDPPSKTSPILQLSVRDSIPGRLLPGDNKHLHLSRIRLEKDFYNLEYQIHKKCLSVSFESSSKLFVNLLPF